MTTNRIRIITAGLLLTLTFPAIGSAQQTRAAGQRSGSAASASSQRDNPPAPAESERNRYEGQPYYRRPTFRLFQNYSLAAKDVTREVFSVLADVQIDGTVQGDVGIVMGNATIGPTAVIEGSLIVTGGSATIADGAKVGHDLVVVGGALEAPLNFSPGGEHVVIGTPAIGESLQAMRPWFTHGILLGRLIVPSLGWNWIVVGVLLFFGVFFNHVFARQVGACADTLARRPLGAFFVGLLVIVLIGPLLMIVAVTVIGLPFALAAMLALNIFGKLAVTRALGRGVVSEGTTPDRAHAFRSFLIGSAILIVALMTPVLGIMTWALITVFGLGTAMMTFLSSMRKERPATPPAAPVPPAPPPVPPVAPPPSFGPPEPVARTMGSDAAMHSSVAAPFVEPVVEPLPPPVQPEPTAFVPPATAPSAIPSATGLLGYPRAAFLDRMVAFVLDAILIAIVNGWLTAGFYTFGRGPDNTFLPMLFAYHVVFWAWKGTTLGGIILNLRMVRTTGEEPRFIDALVRGLSAIFSVAALFIGCLWMLSDPQKQMWHDKFAGTVVVKLPRELVLA